MKAGLGHISVNKEIAGRYYQEEAIKKVCESFEQKNRRSIVDIFTDMSVWMGIKSVIDKINANAVA